MAPKLKFKLEVWESIVLFQVLEMDERFRSLEGGPSLRYKASSGLTVVSVCSPGIGSNTIHLRGEDTDDDLKPDTFTFDSPRRAEEYKQKALSALSEWAENWEGFQNKATIKEENNIYTV